MATSIHETFALGQSIWLDYINKAMINGGLQEWIDLGVTGVTTNPSIFENSFFEIIFEFDAASRAPA